MVTLLLLRGTCHTHHEQHHRQPVGCVYVCFSARHELISIGVYLSPGMKTYIAMPAEIVNKDWKVLFFIFCILVEVQLKPDTQTLLSWSKKATISNTRSSSDPDRLSDGPPEGRSIEESAMCSRAFPRNL